MDPILNVVLGLTVLSTNISAVLPASDKFFCPEALGLSVEREEDLYLQVAK